MANSLLSDLRRTVEPDRVHRSVYTDPDIFERELEQIFHRVWTYVGHDSQVKKPGDYLTVQIGRQPMILARHPDGKVYVLYNRCLHRGNLMCSERFGHAYKPTLPKTNTKTRIWRFVARRLLDLAGAGPKAIRHPI
ncbi:MAG: Rieske 2Fe-2S domain-containing protein, partial [Alphaproteobacteria bacterium]|nr:Rieske 2Fe-2S domain-containing protein [Alphaproteobacteria bacterium]